MQPQKKKRIRRTNEEIDADRMCSAAGRREMKKWETLWDKHGRPVVRLNLAWQYLRLRFVRSVAKMLDVSLEAFVRMAAYERAVKVLAEGSTEQITYKRVLSDRYRKRADIEYLDWRWREPHLELVDKAATKADTDFKTFIDVAAYERAVQIVRTEADGIPERKKILDDLNFYLDCIKDDDTDGAWRG